ncbi:DUF2000 domain-containing protein [Liquorilactobacillus oeni]|uniref:DUF2000 domain-containing protein n=1 Tax=Liquorilactobacillus oeni DSM 19972 TaxID=1423777 RepID=A0A0R1MBF9_9LACO|nr:DUF2000 domain-containing protein [Liquorilactobacillus oeni]KRL05404.1 hypothetical protein FD46_GL000815 [Liquorilactobacillus oeni DSM 19972]
MQTKCVLIIDPELPLGLIANTAAILGCSLGKIHPEINGDDLLDQEKHSYPGIVKIPIPVLKAVSSKVKEIQIETEKIEEIEVISFADCAQTAKNYQEYAEKVQNSNHENIKLLGICLYSTTKKVNHFAGSLSLLR